MLQELFGGGPEKRTQYYVYDDRSFEFRKLELDSTCLVEKKDDKINKGWKHFFATEIPFNGFNKVQADMVTLSCGRDIILDPFDKVPVAANPSEGKPAKNDVSIKKWMAEIAESQRYKVMNQPVNNWAWDKVTAVLAIGFLLELLIFGVSKAWS